MSKLELNIEGIDEINSKLDFILKRIDKRNLSPEHIIYDNRGLQEFLNISSGKASLLRNTGKIAYSKDSPTGKIWYRLSDIKAYLDSCYNERF
ncbi:MAG: hypothetical protein H8E12_04245 [Rhodobacteraceae bacterium]|nr:hypothetical protein [Paracoccaceae bacterium]